MSSNRSHRRNVFKVFLCLLILCLLVSAFYIFRFRRISKEGDTHICRNCNVVVIDVDLLRFDALDCYNFPERTPNICKLKKESVFFKNNSSQSDLTKSDYVSAITSTYPISHQVWTEIHEFNNNLTTLPSVLKTAGYKTSYYGLLSDLVGIYNGFDEKTDGGCSLCKEFNPARFLLNKGDQTPSFGYLYLDDLHFPYLPRSNEKLSNWESAPPGLPVTYDEYINGMKKYIAENPREIFFDEYINNNRKIFSSPLANIDKIYEMYLNGARSKEKISVKNGWKPYSESYFKHIDLENGKDLDYMKESYLIVLGLVDKHLGSFFESLSDNAVSENTIIIFRTDHGEEFREHGRLFHADNLYQYLTHTPLFIKVPGIKAGEVDSLTEDIDVMPTILDLVGVDIPAQVQGKSLVPLMLNLTKSVRDYQIAQKGDTEYVASYRKGNLKLIMKEGKGIELYDLSADPDEENNLTNINPGVSQSLLEEYEKIADALPRYENPDNPLPTWIDEQKKQKLKDEGYY